MVTFINEQLSEHLENLRLSAQTEQALSETEDQARRLAALNTLSEQLATADTFEDVFKVAGQVLPMMISTDQIQTTRVDESGDYLEVFALQSIEGAIPTGMQLSIAGSAVGEAIKRRRPVNIPDLRIEQYLESKSLLDQGLRSTLITPLIVGSQAVGTLNFGSSKIDFYTEHERDLAVQAASLIGSTIDNRQLFYQAQEALAETETMLEITSVANSSLELETTLAQVLTKILDTTDASSGLISVYNKQTQRLELVSHDLPEPFLRKLRTDGLEGTLCDLVYQRKETILLKDLKLESPVDATGLINMGFHAYQGVPLTFKDTVLGTLCVFYHQIITTQDPDTALMEVVGQQIGVAIENANLFEQTQKRAEELDILNEMGRTLTSLQDEQAIFETIYEYTGKLMDVNSFFIANYHKEQHEIAFPVFIDMGERVEMPSQLAGNGLANYIIDSRQPLLISKDFNAQVKELGIEYITVGDDSPTLSWLGVPLVFKDRVIGIVTVQSSTTPGLYTERERDLLTAIASQASIALENANAFRQTQQQAEQEATINLISQRIQSTTSVENALQVAIRELGRALGAKRTNVQLGLPNQQEKFKSGNGFHPRK